MSFKHKENGNWYNGNGEIIENPNAYACAIFGSPYKNMWPYNMFLQCIGVSGWLVVSIIWNDRALIVVNAVAVVIFLNGIFQYFARG